MEAAYGRQTVSERAEDCLSSVGGRRQTLPVPEDAVEMAGVPISYPARHLLDCCPRLLQQDLGGLEPTPRQKPLQGKARDSFEYPTQVGSAHASRSGDCCQWNPFPMVPLDEFEHPLDDLEMPDRDLVVHR